MSLRYFVIVLVVSFFTALPKVYAFYSFAHYEMDGHSILLIGDYSHADIDSTVNKDQATQFVKTAEVLNRIATNKIESDRKNSIILYALAPSYCEELKHPETLRFRSKRTASATFQALAESSLNYSSVKTCRFEPMDERPRVIEAMAGVLMHLHSAFQNPALYEEISENVEALDKDTVQRQYERTFGASTLGEYLDELEVFLLRTTAIRDLYGVGSIEYQTFNESLNQIRENVERFKSGFQSLSRAILLREAVFRYTHRQPEGAAALSAVGIKARAQTVLVELQRMTREGISHPFGSVVFLHRLLEQDRNRNRSAPFLTSLVIGETQFQYIVRYFQRRQIEPKLGSRSAFVEIAGPNGSPQRSFDLRGVPFNILRILKDYHLH